MSYKFIIVLLLLNSSISFSQEAEIKKEHPEEDVYTIVENMPEFPGGQDSMFYFLANNVNYPAEAKANGIQGKVYVNFTVEKDGAISNVKIIKGVHPLLDNEALRVVRLFPKWSPGFQQGKAVKVSYNLPISFKSLSPAEAKKLLKEGKN